MRTAAVARNGHRFRNRFRVKASGSIGPMCFKSGAVACAPPIVRDESSRVFLGGALQQSPPLRRPCSMVGQFSLEVNRKDEPAVRRRPLLPSSKPAEMRAFNSGTDSIRHAAQEAAATDRLSVPTIERFLRTGDETWDGAGSGRFTPAQFENNTAYRRARKRPYGPCSISWRICFRQKPRRAPESLQN